MLTSTSSRDASTGRSISDEEEAGFDDAEEGEELLGFVSFFPQAEKSIAEAATDNASTTDISFFIILSSNPIPDSFKDLFLMTLYHNEKMCQQVNLP